MRDVLRLRQRRQARPVRIELRAIQRVRQPLLRRQSSGQALLLHPARLQTATELPVSQRRRRQIQRREQGVGHRQFARQIVRRGRNGRQQRRTDGLVRRQRHDGQLPVRQQGRRQV